MHAIPIPGSSDSITILPKSGVIIFKATVFTPYARLSPFRIKRMDESNISRFQWSDFLNDFIPYTGPTGDIILRRDFVQIIILRNELDMDSRTIFRYRPIKERNFERIQACMRRAAVAKNQCLRLAAALSLHSRLGQESQLGALGCDLVQTILMLV